MASPDSSRFRLGVNSPPRRAVQREVGQELVTILVLVVPAIGDGSCRSDDSGRGRTRASNTFKCNLQVQLFRSNSLLCGRSGGGGNLTRAGASPVRSRPRATPHLVTHFCGLRCLSEQQAVARAVYLRPIRRWVAPVRARPATAKGHIPCQRGVGQISAAGGSRYESKNSVLLYGLAPVRWTGRRPGSARVSEGCGSACPASAASAVEG